MSQWRLKIMFYDNLTGPQRTFWRWLFFCLLVFALFDVGLHWNSMRDRKKSREQLKNTAAELLKTQTESAERRDARARIQINTINAVLNGRTYTAEEQIEIRDLWNKAEYHLISEKFVGDLEK